MVKYYKETEMSNMTESDWDILILMVWEGLSEGVVFLWGLNEKEQTTYRYVQKIIPERNKLKDLWQKPVQQSKDQKDLFL